MNETSNPAEPKLQCNRGYLVLKCIRSSAHHTDVNMGVLSDHSVYAHLRDAVRELKKIRLSQSEGFIAATTPEQRDKYPFRNKIGVLPGYFTGESIGWGYHWVNAGDEEGDTVAHWMWIQKTLIICRKGEMGEVDELTAKQRQLLDAEGGIDFVADGQFIPVLPENAVFDEATQDFVFDGEGEGNGGEDQT
jgi:hypothetical protein